MQGDDELRMQDQEVRTIPLGDKHLLSQVPGIVLHAWPSVSFSPHNDLVKKVPGSLLDRDDEIVAPKV